MDSKIPDSNPKTYRVRLEGRIVKFLKTNGPAHTGEIAKGLGVSPDTLLRYLRKMVSKGSLEKSGVNVDTVYNV